MKTLSMQPHVGCGPALLGRPRLEVRQALDDIGFPLETARGAIDYFCQAAIQLEFDSEGCLEFMGVSCHDAFSARLYCIDVFEVTAEELFQLIAERDGTGDHAFQRSEYIFTGQIISLWDADEQYDRRHGEKSVVWAQVGIGNQQYLDASRNLKISYPVTVSLSGGD